jgi:hypothetical protein
LGWQSEKDAKTTLDAEAGKIYLIQQHIQMGMVKAENDLEILDEKKAARPGRSARLSRYENK